MVCIPNCDKIVPGMLMATVRANIPTIFVSGGPMNAGKSKEGKAIDLISVFEGVASHRDGKIDEVAVFDRALAASDVADLYRISGMTPPPRPKPKHGTR